MVFVSVSPRERDAFVYVNHNKGGVVPMKLGVACLSFSPVKEEWLLCISPSKEGMAYVPVSLSKAGVAHVSMA